MPKLLLILSLLCFQCKAANTYIASYVFTWIGINKEISLNYLHKGIEIGKPNSDAAYILGTLYLDGDLIEKDLKKADYYISLAANLNHPAAIKSIGDGYYTGDIRKKDIKKSLEYYEKAAKLGYGPAQFNAGIVLLNTASSKKDLKMAIFWLDKASKNDDDLKEITKSALKYKEYAKNKLQEMSRN